MNRRNHVSESTEQSVPDPAPEGTAGDDFKNLYVVVIKGEDGAIGWAGGGTGGDVIGPSFLVGFAIGTPEEAERFRQWWAKTQGIAPDELEVVEFQKVGIAKEQT